MSLLDHLHLPYLHRGPAMAVLKDPGATWEQLYRAATHFPRAVLRHPSMPLLMLSDQQHWEDIRRRVRERQCFARHTNAMAALNWPNTGRLAVSMLRRCAPHVNRALSAECEDVTEPMARMLEITIGHPGGPASFWEAIRKVTGGPIIQGSSPLDREGLAPLDKGTGTLALCILQTMVGTPDKPWRGSTKGLQRHIYGLMVNCSAAEMTPEEIAAPGVSFGEKDWALMDQVTAEARAIVRRYGKSGRRKG